MQRRLRASILCTALAAAGCGGELAQEENGNLGEAEHAVKNGIATLPFSNRSVDLHGCTGTLISDQWVLTASHCYKRKQPLDATATFSTETRKIDRIVHHPSSEAFSGTNVGNVDVAMVHIEAPFSITPTSADPALFAGDTDQLVGAEVRCFGFGAYGFHGSCTDDADCNSGEWCQWGTCLIPSTGLRTAVLNVIPDPEDPDIWYQLAVPNANNQMLLPGDSGGACYLNGTHTITGVAKAGNSTNYNRQSSAEGFRWWVNQKRGCPIFNQNAPDPSLCTPSCPCDVGEGDCDNDFQCRSGLVCTHNVGAKYGLPADYDVCEAPASCPTFDVANKDASFCSDPNCPCSFGEGDCDTDFECGGALVCRHNVGAAVFLPADYDICTYPAAPGCPAFDLNNPKIGFCTPDCKCGPGEGDCETDDDCLPGYFCGTNNGGNFGLPPLYDVCVKKPKLKLSFFR